MRLLVYCNLLLKAHNKHDEPNKPQTENTVVLQDDSKFSFSHVFGPSSTQTEVT